MGLGWSSRARGASTATGVTTSASRSASRAWPTLHLEEHDDERTRFNRHAAMRLSTPCSSINTTERGRCRDIQGRQTQKPAEPMMGTTGYAVLYGFSDCFWHPPALSRSPCRGPWVLERISATVPSVKRFSSAWTRLACSAATWPNYLPSGFPPPLAPATAPLTAPTMPPRIPAPGPPPAIDPPTVPFTAPVTAPI